MDRRGAEGRRFLQLFGGLLGCLLVGPVYAFGIFAEPMKNQFHLSQGDLGTITSIAFVAALFNFPAGFLLDRCGPRAVNLVAFSLLGLGFLLLALSFNGSIAGSTASLSAIYSLCCWPAGFIDAGSLLPNLFLFPLDRGDVVLLEKTFMGLGTTIYTAISVGFFHSSNVAGYCFFVAFSSWAIGCFVMLTVRPPPKMAAVDAADVVNEEGEEQIQASSGDGAANLATATDVGGSYLTYTYVNTVRAPRAPMMVGFALLGVSIVYLSVFVFVNGYHKLDKVSEGGKAALAAAALLCALAFAVLPVVAYFATPKEEGTPVSEGGHRRHEEDEGAETEEAPIVGAAADSAACPPPPFSATAPSYDTPLLATLRGLPDFWLLWAVLFVLWGTGAALTANAAQVYKSANGGRFDKSQNALFVGLGGLAGAIGRVVAGLLEKLLPARSVTTWLFIPCVLNVLAMVGFLVLPVSAFLVPFAFGPAAFGMTWAFVILIARMFFAVDIGKHYGVLFTSGMLSIPIFDRGIMGPWYDHRASEQGTFPHCVGRTCFLLPYLIFLGLNVVAALCSVVIHKRWMRRVEERDRVASAQ